jgi:hypothetical protein
MRGLLILSALLAVALAIDAAEFDGQYRRAVWREVNYEGQQFASRITHLLTGAPVDLPTLRPFQGVNP